MNESLARQLAERFRVADPKAVVGRIAGLNTPQYENRGQVGKAEDVEIVGIIRNERVTDLCRRRRTSPTCRWCRRRAAS